MLRDLPDALAVDQDFASVIQAVKELLSSGGSVMMRLPYVPVDCGVRNIGAVCPRSAEGSIVTGIVSIEPDAAVGRALPPTCQDLLRRALARRSPRWGGRNK